MSMFQLFLFLSFVTMLFVAARAFNLVYKFRQSYYTGLHFWTDWLPVISSIVLFVIIISNLNSKIPILSELLSLSQFLSKFELVLIGLATPFFFSKLGNIVGFIITQYLATKLFLSAPVGGTNPAMVTLLCCSTFLMLLADKSPLQSKSKRNIVGDKIRNISRSTLSISAIILLGMALVKITSTSKLTLKVFDLYIPTILIFASISILLIAWLSLTLSSRMQFIPLLVYIPTIFTLTNILNISPYIVTIPSTVCFALMLTLSDRRAAPKPS